MHIDCKKILKSKLHIYIPDSYNAGLRKKLVPPLYPFKNGEHSFIHKSAEFGQWTDDVQLVQHAADADIMLPCYYLEYYRENNKLEVLKDFHEEAVAAHVQPIYFSSGDMALIPPLGVYDLFVHGIFNSLRSNNLEIYPNFFPDPLGKYFNGGITYHTVKSTLPLCGFCGQAYAGWEKKYMDYGRVIKQKLIRHFNSWCDEAPPLQSASYTRSKILQLLQQSKLVTCNFITEKKYRGGVMDAVEKEASAQRYFENMQQSLYIICYRGTGNFSVRFYETLAAGRIPVIIRSNDLLPFQGMINWELFPMIPENRIDQADKIIAAYHAAHSAEALFLRQQYARSLYENYFSYKGFMQAFVQKYIAQTQ